MNSVLKTWRVRCEICRWTGYRRLATPYPFERCVQPCPNGHLASVIPLSPRVERTPIAVLSPDESETA